MYAPLLIAGLLGTAAGTGMQIAGNAQSQSALNSERAAENRQQTGFQNKAQAEVNSSLAQSTAANEQKQTATGTADRISIYNALQDATAPATKTPGKTSSGNTIVGGPTAGASRRASGAGTAWSNLAAKSQATEGGYSDWENQQNVKNATTMGNLSVIGTQASNAASIYPLEQQVAMQKGQPLSGWGQLLSTLGSLSMMGASVVGAPAAGASAADTGAGMAYDWSNPATWGNELLQPAGEGAVRVLPSSAASGWSGVF